MSTLTIKWYVVAATWQMIFIEQLFTCLGWGETLRGHHAFPDDGKSMFAVLSSEYEQTRLVKFFFLILFTTYSHIRSRGTAQFCLFLNVIVMYFNIGVPNPNIKYSIMS